MSNIFSTVETLSTPRSKQKMKFKNITSYSFGKLYPCFAMDCVPSDTVKIDMASVVKCLPMVAPNMTPDKMTVHFWFVPYRLLDENFTAGVKGFDDTGKSYSYAFPKWTPNATGNVGTLWDYFGLPINVKESSGVLVEDNTYVDGVEPTSYLKRAYNLVFNTMYRNENTTDEVDLDSDDIQYRCWRADYFTKSLPLPQKPYDLDSVFGLPIEAYNLNPGSRIFDQIYFQKSGETDINSLGNLQFRVHTQNPISSNPTQSNPTVAFNSDRSKCRVGPRYTDTNDVYLGIGRGNMTPNEISVQEEGYVWSGFEIQNIINNIGITGFDQSDFRLWMQLQKWAERSNRSGSNRYDEFILSHFGVKPQDARLQLPEFLGGIKTPIAVADEFAQADSQITVGGNTLTRVQGQRTGVAGALLADRIRPYHCQEFGCIIGIASILPQAEYMQGVDKQWIKHDSLDFFRHEFCCLSDDKVKNGQLCVSNGKYYTTDAHTTTDDLSSNERKAFNEGLFGYQGIYDEMRFFMNKITGQMRTLFSHWHQARNFDATADEEKNSQVKLNANFVEARDVALRPFVVQDGTNDVFLVKHTFKVTAYRPCTARAIPGYADHF